MDIITYALSKTYTDKSIAGTSGVLVGKSAYEIAVLNGFSGSESEWLDSLRGSGINRTELQSTEGLIKTYRIYYDDGDTYDYTVSDGEKGDTGDKGDTGSVGKDGTNATINGRESIEISAGNNIQIIETVDGIAISATGGGSGGAVDSVNGQTGVVVLNKSDIGLSNVDNVSDLDKPVSTATQETLNVLNTNKADKSEIPTELPNPNSLTFTGAVTGSYDGSSALTVNIPASSAGGTTVTVDGNPVEIFNADTKQNSLSAQQLTNINEIPSIKETADSAIQTETDPTVPAWAKAPTKPTYTASEVGALPSNTSLFSGNYNDLANKPDLKNGHVETVSNSDFTDGKVVITHGLNSENIIVQVFDNTKERVIENGVQITTINSITLDMQPYVPIIGEYKVHILKLTI